MHGKSAAHIADNTIAVNVADPKVSASTVLASLKSPVDPSITPQFAKPEGPAFDFKTAFPPGSKGITFKP